jgi:hypothetical protein
VPIYGHGEERGRRGQQTGRSPKASVAQPWRQREAPAIVVELPGTQEAVA